MTQLELAQKMGKMQSTVSVWESGKAAPTTEDVPKIADILGCTIDELFGRGERHGAVSEDSTDA